VLRYRRHPIWKKVGKERLGHEEMVKGRKRDLALSLESVMNGFPEAAKEKKREGGRMEGGREEGREKGKEGKEGEAGNSTRSDSLYVHVILVPSCNIGGVSALGANSPTNFNQAPSVPPFSPLPCPPPHSPKAHHAPWQQLSS